MIKVFIFLLVSVSASAQTGWYLSGDTLRYNDGAGKSVQINKTGLFTLKTELKDSLDIIRASKQPVGSYLVAADLATERAASVAISNKTIATFNYAADAGANDSYVVSLNPAPAAYTTGMIIFFKANTVNTGAASINVNGLGAKTIVKRVNTALANGDIPALSISMIIYDGTNFKLINPVVN